MVEGHCCTVEWCNMYGEVRVVYGVMLRDTVGSV